MCPSNNQSLKNILIDVKFMYIYYNKKKNCHTELLVS